MKRTLPLIFPSALVLIGLFLAFKNYTPGTFLVGWDSLHPEFNFRLAFERAFSGVWREDQGLGALAAHSHMSDLPRILILWLESFFIPQSFLRYSFIFLCLILGALGFYFVFDFIFRKNDRFTSSFASFLASLFYLLNLVVLQHFYVPFEMFCVQFAFLPWVFLFLTKFLDEGGRKNLFWFSLLSFLASPQAYASALYWAFLVSFCAFLGTYFLLDRKVITFKRALALLFFQIAVNSYWLLPNLYSVLNGSSTIVNSKINQLFSPEVFIRNQDYGKWKDIILGKNFLFEWRAFDFKSNTFADLMASWGSYLHSPYLGEIGVILFVLSILGIVLSLFARKKELWSLLPVLVISLFFLQNVNGPLGSLYRVLVDKYEIFREGFRMPFTKFSIIYQFALSFYFGVFFFCFFIFLKRIKFRLLVYLSSLVVFSVLVYRCLPFFKGDLVSSVVKSNLPIEYFQLFNFFLSHSGRVSVFPIYTLWGWEYHNWQYEGSGFLGFGIESPLLVRDYDRWSPYNESFYNEASSALYKYHLIFPDKVRPCQTKKECEAEEKLREGVEDWNREVIKEFEKVLEKYDVFYLLLDESIINAGGDAKLLYLDQIKDLVAKSSRIKEIARFDFLTVYHFAPWAGSDSVQTPRSYYFINTDLKYSKYDPIYQKYGDYFLAISHQPSAISFPFVNFDSRGPVKIQEVFEDGQGWLKFENNNANAKVLLPIAEKIEEKFGEGQGFDEGYNCDLKKKGRAVKTRLEKGNFYGAYDGGVSCDWFYYPDLDRSRAWLFRIKGKNLAGRGLKIYLQNLRTGRMDLEELLKSDENGEFDSYFVIYPSESADLYKYTTDFENTPKGFTLNVETRSFGRIFSENIIEDITFIPIDTDWISQLRSALEEPQEIIQDAQIIESKKYGTFGYEFKLESSQENRLLTISQGFDRGWVAFTLKNIKVNYFEHVKVNGWKNGWLIPASESDVFVFFWPQSLQWIGFGFLGLSFAILLFGHGKEK